MGYVKVVQYGTVTEIYQYQKDYVPQRKRNTRRAKRRKSETYRRNYSVFLRRSRSVRRAAQNFFRIVAANIQRPQNLAFVTLTCYENLDVTVGYRALADFFKRLRAKTKHDITYIAVPEFQKRGSLHFHVLVWGLSEEVAGKERTTRNCQRQWARGYVDIRLANRKGLGIAGYMAKYLVKGLTDNRLANRRAYTTGGKVYRPTAKGFYQGDDEMVSLLTPEFLPTKKSVYNTKYLGECTHRVYQP